MEEGDFYDRDTDQDDDLNDQDAPSSPTNDDKPNDDSEKEEAPVTVLDFFEKEAELSGDEASSDEDDDEEEDEEQQEVEEDLPDEVEQRDQIGRLFAKQQHDEDERQLLLYQERLLEDGEFHMEGKERKRKFQWRKANNNAWLDQADDSDDEEEENEPVNSDDESNNPEIQDIYSQVKINVREPGSDEGTTVNNVLQDATLQRPTVFSGPASSILSYIVRDRKTVEFLSGKSSSPQALLLKRNFAKKRKVKRLTDHY